MSVETSLVRHLRADPVVGPLTKINADRSRIYPLLIPQHMRGEKSLQPCLVYQRVGSIAERTFCGTDTLWQASIQYDSYALTYESAKELSAAVKACLVDLAGTIFDTRIDMVQFGTEFDSFEPDPGLFRVFQVYNVFYVEE